ncbi:MAG: sulfur carrier protein ThiS [Acetobacteraceae bacterium]|nr:sulfur carrier protein ThiS [Acetobacteraceae bacterium]
MVVDVEVFVTGEKRQVALPAEATVRGLLRSLGIASGGVLVCVNGRHVIEDHPLADRDRVQIISAISGG